MRCLLVAVADDPRSKVMFTWVVNHQLKQDDRVHLLHVAMREVSSEGFALPGSDYFDQAHPASAHKIVQEMLLAQFVAPLLAAFPQIHHTVHVVQAGQDRRTVARIICEKAEQLQVDQVFIGGSSSHEKSKVAQLLGTSIVPYVEHHCKVPVTVVVKEAAQGTVQRHTNN